MAALTRSFDCSARARRVVTIAACAALLVGTLGCGSETVVTPATSLTPADQLTIASRIAMPAAVAVGMLTPDLSTATVHRRSAFADAAIRPAPGAAASAVSAVAVASFPVDRAFNCPTGGSARTTGTLSGSLEGAGSGALNFLLFTSFAACQVTSSGRTLLLDADPGVQVKGSYVVSNRVPADPQTVTLTGTVNVSVSGSRAPALPCAILLTVTTSASTHVANVSGTVCGAAVSSQFTWTP